VAVIYAAPMGHHLEIGTTDALLDYLAGLGARTDDVLDRVRRETAELPNAVMQVAPEQGALLELLARLIGATRILEVGTFTGYSAICLARGLAPGGRLLCLEVDEEYAAIATANLEDAGVGERAEVRVGPAAPALRAMPEAPTFDLAFIDADKPGYPEYYELIVPRVRAGGLILLDNMLQRGTVVEPDTENARVIDALNRRIHDDERVDMALVVVADGVTFARKRGER
jgi:predicted O-methyltransferase YrrM